MPISREAVLDWIKAYAEALAANKDYLTQLDSDIATPTMGPTWTAAFRRC